MQSAARDSYRDTAVFECRRLFLIAASDHPKIQLAKTLKKKVFHKALSQPDQLEPLLWEWARSHNLEYPWVIDEARFLYGISSIPSNARERLGDSQRFFPADFGTTHPAYEGPDFAAPPWSPVESLDAFRKRVKQRFKEELEKYICDLKHAQKSNRVNASARHYRWAAERICLGLSWSDIAVKTEGLSRQAVQKAVRKIFRILGVSDSVPARHTRASNQMT
ncbi:MAG TPA: hypothetical protein VGR73_18080 [Bryobacteraceae bacterium]|nr:hypothetical protein [Bryobacteraceae bacterium]